MKKYRRKSGTQAKTPTPRENSIAYGSCGVGLLACALVFRHPALCVPDFLCLAYAIEVGDANVHQFLRTSDTRKILQTLDPDIGEPGTPLEDSQVPILS